MSLPNLLTLSDMSVTAMLAISAAFAVSPPRPWSRRAEKLVTVCMYSLAESPAVRNASAA